MTMPGFTAEGSLTTNRIPYRVTPARMIGNELIIPQLVSSNRLGRCSFGEEWTDVDSLSSWESLEIPSIAPRLTGRLGSTSLELAT
jgi:hypothetical protein